VRLRDTPARWKIDNGKSCGRSARDVEQFPSGGSGPDRCRGIFGVDELMDMGRTCVDLIGNCLATIVIARWEGEFDDERPRVFGTTAEAEMDLKSGDLAFADAVAQGD
jgi:hypothetical protein